MKKWITEKQSKVISKIIRENGQIDCIGIDNLDDTGNMYIFEFDEKGTIIHENKEDKQKSSYWSPDGVYLGRFL